MLGGCAKWFYISILKPVFHLFDRLVSRSDAEVLTYDDYCATAGRLFYPLHTCWITKSQTNPEIIAACMKDIKQRDTSMHVNKSGIRKRACWKIHVIFSIKYFMLAMYGVLNVCNINLCNRRINRTRTQNGTAAGYQQQPIPPHSPSILHNSSPSSIWGCFGRGTPSSLLCCRFLLAVNTIHEPVKTTQIMISPYLDEQLQSSELEQGSVLQLQKQLLQLPSSMMGAHAYSYHMIV